MENKPEIKWMWNGPKVNGKLYPAWYSKGLLRGETVETITVGARNYSRFPDMGLAVENNSDLMTDYFEKDKIRISPEMPEWPEVLAAWEKQQAHEAKRKAKRAARYEERRARNQVLRDLCGTSAAAARRDMGL